MIYRFIDTADRTPRADIPAEAMNINGQYLEDVVPGYRTLAVAGRESMSAEVNTLEAGRANGVQYNYRRYPERVITITYQILSDTPEDFRRAFNALGGALNCEQVKLIFNDELDKYFIGTPGEIGEIEPGKNKVTGEFQIVCTDPFKYSCTEYKTEVALTTPKKILYNGTVPAYPSRIYATNTDADLWFLSLSIDNNLLTFSKNGSAGKKVGNMSEYTQTSDSGWTVNTSTTEGTLGQYMIEGKIRYQSSNQTDVFRLDVYGETGDSDLTPRIRLYRDYTSDYPLTELRFMVGYDIVYRQIIDDDLADNRFPFRISFKHTPITVSTRLGQMTGTYFFQFRDVVFQYRKSWAWSVSSSSSIYEITGAKFAAASHYMGTMVTNWDRTSINLYNVSFDNSQAYFPYNDATIIYPETEELLVRELPTPQFCNPVNRWEDFKLKPGENTLNCNGFGAGRSSLKVTYYWREKYI